MSARLSSWKSCAEEIVWWGSRGPSPPCSYLCMWDSQQYPPEALSPQPGCVILFRKVTHCRIQQCNHFLRKQLLVAQGSIKRDTMLCFEGVRSQLQMEAPVLMLSSGSSC